MTQEVVRRSGPGRPPKAIERLYSAAERELAIEYVISNGGDIVAAQQALMLDEGWTREGYPAQDTIKQWCRVRPEAKKYIDIWYSYNTREHLIDTAERILTSMDDEQANRGKEDKLAAGYAERTFRLAGALQTTIEQYHLLVHGSKVAQMGRMGPAIPRNGTPQLTPGNEDAIGDETPSLVAGNTTINLFSRREVLVLASDLQNLKGRQALEAFNNGEGAFAVQDETPASPEEDSGARGRKRSPKGKSPD